MVRSMRALLVVGFVCLAAGCGSSGGGGTDAGPDVVVTPPDVPADVPADVPGDPGPGEDVTADPGKDVPATEDVTTDLPDVPPQACEPACKYADGQYCDEAKKACADLACTPCWRDVDCGAGGLCLDVEFTGGARASVCSKACATDADCAPGFACGATSKRCEPRAQCPAPACDGSLGARCDKGGVNAGCAACGAELTCIGSGVNESSTCQFDRDCVLEGYPREWQPDCVGGHCGWAVCASSCWGKECPEGYEKNPAGFGACWCMKAGKAKAGEPCPVFNVHPDAESCGAGMACLGIEATAETTACTKDEDCPKGEWQYNRQCVDGHCGLSLCSPTCAADGTCQEGFGPAKLGDGSCYCFPESIGASPEGGACPFGNVNTGADFCVKGLMCLGIPSSAETDACTTVADCDKDAYSGHAECIDGHCGTSFCSSPCDDKGRCTGAYMPLEITDLGCYCLPVEVGTSKAGEPCPSGVLHPAASACAAELSCLAIAPSADTKACTVDGDCPAGDYFNGQCSEGHCGASFCSPYCDDLGKCGDGFVPALVGTTCLCIPVVTGTSVAGAACPVGTANAAADECAPGVLCLGVSAANGSALCASDADCLFPNGDCVDGVCGFSYCAAYCDAQGACAAGEPVNLETGTCVCAPAAATGAGVAGDPCPLGDVHVASPACGADLTCQGVWAFATSTACTAAADCGIHAAFGADCVQGHCGFAACAAACDAAGTCAAGSSAYLEVGASDRCVCRALAAGTAVAGEACAGATVNPSAGTCAAGLACLVLDPGPGSTACKADADCTTAVAADAKCLQGFCAYSRCIAACGTGKACGAGTEAYDASDGHCWCVPKAPAA